MNVMYNIFFDKYVVVQGQQKKTSGGFQGKLHHIHIDVKLRGWLIKSNYDRK